MFASAGLEPSINQSKTLKSNGKKLTWFRSFNPTFYDFYLKKCSESRSHRVALSHACKKLVRLIYALETKHVDFDPSLLK